MEYQKKDDFLRCRVPEATKKRLVGLAQEKAASVGKFCSVADILLSALAYGLPFVERDIRIGIDTEVPSSSKADVFLRAAKHLIDRGLATIPPAELDALLERPGAAAAA